MYHALISRVDFYCQDMDKSRLLNTQLDQFQLEILESKTASLDGSEHTAVRLQNLTSSLEKHPKLPKLAGILESYDFSAAATSADDSLPEWLILARASVILVDAVIRDLFKRSLPLTDDLSYWDQLLMDRLWRTLYGIQSEAIGTGSR